MKNEKPEKNIPLGIKLAWFPVNFEEFTVKLKNKKKNWRFLEKYLEFIAVKHVPEVNNKVFWVEERKILLEKELESRKMLIFLK